MDADDEFLNNQQMTAAAVTPDMKSVPIAIEQVAPGRYVAPAAPATPLRSFADELAEIDATLRTQLAEARTLDDQLVELLDHLRPPNP